MEVYRSLTIALFCLVMLLSFILLSYAFELYTATNASIYIMSFITI